VLSYRKTELRDKTYGHKEEGADLPRVWPFARRVDATGFNVRIENPIST
jgi:hypothetical protein